MKKKVIVTGGAGFIGSAIIPRLVNSNMDVSVIDNLSFGNRDFIDVLPENFYETDIRDENAVIKVMEAVKPDYVIHLAAIHFIPYCNQHPFEAADINIRGTMNVLNA